MIQQLNNSSTSAQQQLNKLNNSSTAQQAQQQLNNVGVCNSPENVGPKCRVRVELFEFECFKVEILDGGLNIVNHTWPWASGLTMIVGKVVLAKPAFPSF